MPAAWGLDVPPLLHRTLAACAMHRCMLIRGPSNAQKPVTSMGIFQASCQLHWQQSRHSLEGLGVEVDAASSLIRKAIAHNAGDVLHNFWDVLADTEEHLLISVIESA